MATSATTRRKVIPGRAAEGPAKPGAIARFGGGLSGPGLVVFGLLAVALAYPLMERPGADGSRIELPQGSLVADVSFAPDGTLVYLDHKRLGPTMLDVDGSTLRRGPSAEGISSTRLAVDPAGRCLVVALADGSLQVLDPETLEPIRTLAGPAGRVMDLSFSGDGARLASADSAGTIRLWDVAAGRLDREFRRPYPLSSCALSADGRRLAVGGQDGSIELIRLDEAGALGDATRWEGHGDKQIIFDLKFSPDGRTLTSLGQDNTLRLWDADGTHLSPRKEIRYPGGVSLCIAMGPDGRTLATGHLDGHIRLWDATTGDLIEERQVDTFQASSLCFSPDGRRLVVGSGSAVSLLDLSEAA